ncbi:hypothetical protein [Bryobacter aggregatus]|uniref:hypothetical protein n=1 Tax=Bryobacter aggregatus TaxID=360054 RepID=UPI0004E0B505|nr:hypothetical protein [Bryobacter aggregatus]
MIRILAFTLLAVGFAGAQTVNSESKAAPRVAASKPDPKTPPVKRHPDGRPLGVPWAAVKIADGAWRITENGKPVIYRSTAFGFTKVSEEENGKIQRMIDGHPDENLEVPAGMTVTEEGDKLRFKRITPFGPYEWVKDKKDLTGVEKAAWAQSKGAAKK